MRRSLFGAVLVALVTLTTAVGRSQERRFEVASVRLTAPKTYPSERVNATRVDLTNITLRQLLWMAFGIDPTHSADRLVALD